MEEGSEMKKGKGNEDEVGREKEKSPTVLNTPGPPSLLVLQKKGFFVQKMNLNS